MGTENIIGLVQSQDLDPRGNHLLFMPVCAFCGEPHHLLLPPLSFGLRTYYGAHPVPCPAEYGLLAATGALRPTDKLTLYEATPQEARELQRIRQNPLPWEVFVLEPKYSSRHPDLRTALAAYEQARKQFGSAELMNLRVVDLYCLLGSYTVPSSGGDWLVVDANEYNDYSVAMDDAMTMEAE